MNQDQLIEYVLGVRDEHGFSALKQGGALTRLMEINWTGSHSTFRKWVEKELGMRWNDARSKMKIYEKLLQSKVTEEQLEGLRWSKIAIIAPALSPENCAHWIAKAKEITLGELREMVEADQKASGEKGKSDVTTWCAKLHADQEKTWLTALDKVKAEVNTKFDAVAMDALAIGYLGGSVPLAEVNAKPWMKSMGCEAVLDILAEVFPEVDLTVAIPEEPKQGNANEE